MLAPAIQVAALAIPAASPADDWEMTRNTLVDPLKSDPHRHPGVDLRQLKHHVSLRVGYLDPSWEITEAEVTARTPVSCRQLRFE